ncbi:oligosaccharide flippase family protein [Kroppenstedtia eburnea]|uniref:Polysaccharide transporter, PST family n=1 Tax=Kroppenstedtia eburnea TaxID=714067 RepID=A0A1N7MU19_9BACL|nr:polysaccharide biosynthesis protein [Kroppenstedtia eburnea]QKI80651.1 polysaccharide biosynthesis protein [Kroppenstedtia eburnea]SIS89461.1 polysaccharide transporter, PST family [Kroppenstedtia eburnea]
MEQGKQSFMKGAAILAAAAFITKLLGAVYKIPYQNITGNEGMFVYQQVYPLYSTLLTVATAGFPIAVSKLVSERLAWGDEEGARRVFRVTSVLLTLSGLGLFFLLYLGAPVVAGWMGSRELLTLPIQAVSTALLVVPIMSVIRGYFQGRRNMTPTAVSQVVEQGVRVVTILTLAWWFTVNGYGVVYAGAGAVFGAFTGAVAGLVVLLVYWNQNRKGMDPIPSPPSSASGQSPGNLVRRLVALSIPISLGALVLPLFSLADSFTVANLLEAGGWSSAEAVEWKGIYDRGQPLIQFASFFATALSLSIVPVIAEAQTLRDGRKIADRSALALRLTLFMGLPASLGLALVARPTNVMLYKDGAGSEALAILAVTTLFSTLAMTSSGILQGMDRVVLPAWHLGVGIGVKLAGNALLIPVLDIRGAALATVLGYAAAAVLNLLAIRRRIGSLFRLGPTKIPLLLATLAMGSVVWVVVQGTGWVTAGWSPRLSMTVASLSGVMAGAAVYGVALPGLGVVRRRDLERVPKVGGKLIPWMERFHLLKS